jgi:hypothetical protein
MKGYIQDQSIFLTDELPTDLRNGDEVEIILVKKQQPSTNLSLGQDYQTLAQQWDSIPDEIAAQLQAEFAEDDQAFAEATLMQYSQISQAEAS